MSVASFVILRPPVFTAASITRWSNGNSGYGGESGGGIEPAEREEMEEMKLPVERIYSTNWWNRTDGYSSVHFAISLRCCWRVSYASDKRVGSACNFPWKPKPSIYLTLDLKRVHLHRWMRGQPSSRKDKLLSIPRKISSDRRDRLDFPDRRWDW